MTFLQSIFGGAAPGQTLTGTVIFTPTNLSISAITVTINVSVLSPSATISAISPTVVPTSTSGSFTVVLTGSGFVYSGGASLVTKAGIVSSGAIVYDSLVVPTVNNSNSISLQITSPPANSTDPYLAALANGGTLVFGVCNPGGTNCSTPASTFNLTIGVNPIVQAVTSASSFMQAAAPALTPVSAYDLLSIFGSNFCVSNGTGCTSPNPAIMYGVTDPANPTALRYVTALSPDAAGGITRTA